MALQKKIILICGLSHSGSTMLDAVLGNDPKGFSCGELYYLYRKIEKVKCCCSIDGKCGFWENLRKIPPDKIHEHFLQSYDFVVDSSKKIGWAKNVIKRGLHEVKLILIWKPIIYHYYSVWKRRHDKTIIEKVVKSSRKYYSDFLTINHPYISVNLHSLLIDPWQKNLKKICQYVGIPWTRQKIEFWRDKRHRLYGGRTVAKIMRGRMPEEIYSPKDLLSIKNFPMEQAKMASSGIIPVLSEVISRSEKTIVI